MTYRQRSYCRASVNVRDHNRDKNRGTHILGRLDAHDSTVGAILVHRTASCVMNDATLHDDMRIMAQRRQTGSSVLARDAGYEEECPGGRCAAVNCES